MSAIHPGDVIAAVRTPGDFQAALATGCRVIFDLAPDLFTLPQIVRDAHRQGKELYIHFDLASGIGKDRSGLSFVKQAGVDGIISTRINIVKMARELGLFTVQRFFLLDSQSLNTTVEGVRASKADMIEIMPGLVPKAVKWLQSQVDVPIIAGGLIETKAEVDEMLSAGATAVSTGRLSLCR